MSRNLTTLFAIFTAVSFNACGGATNDTGASTIAATNSGVGDPCVTGDEALPTFSGFAATEVNIESRSPSCETGICLAYDFAGRVGCPYGGDSCRTTGSPNVPVTVPVPPQLVARPPSSAVYCSCRCDGEPGTGPLCACPSGFACEHIVTDFGFGQSSLAGSYCIKDGTQVKDATALAGGPRCDASLGNCESR